MDLGLGWIGYLIIAVLLAGMNFVLIKKGLEGMSAAMAVAIEAAVLLLIRLTYLDFKGLLESMAAFSPGAWGKLLIYTLILTAGWIAFFVSLHLTSEIGVAPFAMFSFVVIAVVNCVLERSIPSWQMIIILLLLAVGIFLMGFGREHKNSLWWIGAIGGSVLIALYRILTTRYPVSIDNDIFEAAQLLIIVIVASIAAVFMRHGDFKKVTVYHLFFIVLGALCLHFAPFFYGKALSGTSIIALVRICYALWLFVNILGAHLLFKEKMSNTGTAGLAMITAGAIWLYL